MRSAETFALNYLFNSLWQVPLLFLGALLSVRLLRRQASVLTNRVWIGTLALEVLLPAFSSRASWVQSVLDSLRRNSETTSRDAITVTLGPVTQIGSIHIPPVVLHGIALAYGLVVLTSLLRFLSAAFRTISVARHATPVRLEGAIAAQWFRTLRSFSLQRVELWESDHVRVPLTVGLIRPRIVVPTGLLEGLSAEEVCTLFAHECAHVQRKDFGWNLVHELVSLPLAYHPLLQRTRGRIAETREWACDEQAAQVTGTPANYARSLLRLASLLSQPLLDVAPHAIGLLDANALERRVMHLISEQQRSTRLRRFAALGVSMAIACTTCASAWALRTGISLPQQQATEPDRAVARIPSGEMAGHIETRVNPVYPPEAREAHIQGSVVLRAVISKKGVIENLSVLSGPEELTDSAVEAVKQWVYTPYELNGEPVDVQTIITVNYQLND